MCCVPSSSTRTARTSARGGVKMSMVTQGGMYTSETQLPNKLEKTKALLSCHLGLSKATWPCAER